MLKTRSKTCGQPYGEPHPARNRKDAGERPQPKCSDVTKPRYRGGCTAYYRCFQAPTPGQGAGANCAMNARVPFFIFERKTYLLDQNMLSDLEFYLDWSEFFWNLLSACMHEFCSYSLL